MLKPVAFLLLLCTIAFAGSVVAQTAQLYYNQGNEKYKLKDYTGALENYNKAIELDPK